MARYTFTGPNAVGTVGNRIPAIFKDDRDPTQYDVQGYDLLDQWLNTVNQTPWVLVSLEGNATSKGSLARWVKFGLGTVETLTGNSGGPVGPDVNDNINVIGDGTYITIVGTPVNNTLTANLINGGTFATSFPTDFTSPATPALGVLNIFGGVSLDAEQVALVYRKNAHTAAVTNTVFLKLNDSLSFPATNAAGTAGVIYSGGVTAADRFLHNFGGNTFLGKGAGNLTLTATGQVGLGNGVLASLTTGGAQPNTAAGDGSMRVATVAGFNSSFGAASLASNVSSNANCAFGQSCMDGLVSGAGQNVGMGYQVLTPGSAGSYTNCVAVGYAALTDLVSGTQCVALGHSAGVNLNGAESHDIYINNNGVNGESNVLRIGSATGTGNQELNKAFIAGIRGITSDANDAIAVLISSTGQLCTTSSSARTKENIEDMGAESKVLNKLRPVIFNYKKHAPEHKNFGLIAEEVAVVAPRLVVYDKDGIPETVRYDQLTPMLLNELQKHCKTLEDRDKVIAELLDRVAILEEKVIFGKN